jgi:hypothetical protein
MANVPASLHNVIALISMFPILTGALPIGTIITDNVQAPTVPVASGLSTSCDSIILHYASQSTPKPVNDEATTPSNAEAAHKAWDSSRTQVVLPANCDRRNSLHKRQWEIKDEIKSFLHRLIKWKGEPIPKDTQDLAPPDELFPNPAKKKDPAAAAAEPPDDMGQFERIMNLAVPNEHEFGPPGAPPEDKALSKRKIDATTGPLGFFLQFSNFLTPEGEERIDMKALGDPTLTPGHYKDFYTVPGTVNQLKEGAEEGDEIDGI